jgi:hypothetical protein
MSVQFVILRNIFSSPTPTNVSLSLPSGQEVSIPSINFVVNQVTTVVLIEYSNSTLFQTNDTTRYVTSSVISIDIEGINHGVLLHQSISIIFDVSTQNNVHYTCCYWNYTSNLWKSDGCYLHGIINNSRIECRCEHLTNFAVLADVGGSSSDTQLSAANELALELITYIGCGISILGLVITVFTFLIFPVSAVLVNDAWVYFVVAAFAITVKDCTAAPVLHAHCSATDILDCH